MRYNVLAPQAEINGVLAACRELDVALIAHSPLFHGLLADKDHPVRVAGLRRFLPAYRGQRLRAIHTIAMTLRAVAHARERTVAQVALNWLLCQGDQIIPIPGAKHAAHARAIAGALGWRLTPDEMMAINQSEG